MKYTGKRRAGQDDHWEGDKKLVNLRPVVLLFHGESEVQLFSHEIIPVSQIPWKVGFVSQEVDGLGDQEF